MPVRIIRGKIGSGKSRFCTDEIALARINKKNRCIMLVPDNHSFETEKLITQRFGGTGLNNIDVFTFRKLARYYLGNEILSRLTPAGKRILIYSAVENAKKELENIDSVLLATISKPGFLEIAEDMIDEMKRYLISPETLHETAEKAEGTLSQKLKIISCIYSFYNKFIEKSGYSDSADDMIRLAEVIKDSGDFNENTYIWVDKFGEFFPQQLKVIDAFDKMGVNVTVTVDCPEEDEYGTYDCKKKIIEYFSNAEEEVSLSETNVVRTPELDFLLENRNNPRAVYEKSTKNIHLFRSREAYGEVEHTAKEILAIVRGEYGSEYRFRDIAVLCGDEELFSHLIETVFNEYEIPYFSDTKIKLSDHPAALQILSLFDIIDDGFSYESMFRYLRAGYIYTLRGGKYRPLPQTDIDLLENFVLKYGIRGKNKWFSENVWNGETDIISVAFGKGNIKDSSFIRDEDYSYIDDLRRAIVEPLRNFSQKTENRMTGREFAYALWEFMQNIHLYEGLNDEAMGEEASRAERLTKIWNLLLEVLTQAVITVGDEVMTRSEFGERIKAGFSQCVIRTVPAGVDRVYIGSAEHSTASNVKALFIIGAVSGTFPNEITNAGFLSDNDRETLFEEGIILAPDTRMRTEEKYFKVYQALCAATEYLFLSYSVQSHMGAAQRPSQLIIDISEIFPKLSVSDNIIEDREYIEISSPRATLHNLLIKHANHQNPLTKTVYDWYKDRDEFSGALNVIKTAGDFKERKVELSSDIASGLYHGDVSYSYSRLDSFSQCPFMYFMKYGLKAYEREEWEITAASAGTYAHEIIEKFCREVEGDIPSPVSLNDKGNAGIDISDDDFSEEKRRKWRELKEEKEESSDITRDDILEKLINETCLRVIDEGVNDKEKVVSIFSRMGKSIKKAAKTIHHSLKNSRYTIKASEGSFDVKIDEGIRVRGSIDRIDAYTDENGVVNFRVIDYKTGADSFDIVNIVNNYHTQLVIYALAQRQYLSECGIKSRPTGLYYNRVRNELVPLTSSKKIEYVKSEQLKNNFLSGVTFIDDIKIDSELKKEELNENSIVFDIDTELKNSLMSDFISIQIDKDYKLRPYGKERSIKGVRSVAEMEKLLKFVRDGIKKSDRRIREGCIDIAPYDEGFVKNACTYCDYSASCSFDREMKTMRQKIGNEKDAWNLIKNYEEEDSLE